MNREASLSGVEAAAPPGASGDAAGVLALLAWARDAFPGRVALSSSFQTQSLPLLHMVSIAAPELPVLFLDTGFHFPETLEYRDRVVERLGLRLRVLRPALPEHRSAELYGPDPFRRDPDLCCQLRKVEPMWEAMREYDAWISGIRRDQSPARAGAQLIEYADRRTRIHPMLDWTAADVAAYVVEHDLPRHPLEARGYASIGCAPCTRSIRLGETERSGRWPGTDRQECGLHTRLRQDERPRRTP